MSTIEKVIMNLKIRSDGMSLTELNEVCFATYQKTLIGSKVSRVKELMIPTLKYLEETGKVIVKDGIVKLKEEQ
ncbi:hypothetical protein [Clostridium sp.]|uniref:hypothetical protein n=1 Tax=Clostridium sp. TaxID=1506 RepID=UPI002846F143|nr:hypothetical protein [Clostridium sp.]MDR3598738.1 hypothetical protein [Clostridium sp.]